MSNRLATLFRFNLGYLDKLLAEVTEELFTHRPATEVKPPAWIVGHLAQVHDTGRKLLGEQRRLPPEYKDAFGVGSDPGAESFPPMSELLGQFHEVSDGLLAAAERVDWASLDEPNPFEGMRGALPTKGDLIAHMMTTHFATHLGQLSVWRRMMGHPPMV